MLRRTPLARKTKLPRGDKPLARTEFARNGRRPWTLRSRPSKRARPDEPLADWCEAALEDVCAGRAVHRHHRLLRSQGGGDEATNTLDLCHACHRYIHDHTGFSYQRGFLLHPYDPCCDLPDGECEHGGVW